MMENEPQETQDVSETEEAIQAMRQILGRQIRLVDILIAILLGHQSASSFRNEEDQVAENVSQALIPLLQAIGSSSNTLVVLSGSSGLHTRDCYSVARSIVEASVNACYIMAKGEEAANRALRHATQKGFRDLERESRIGDSVIRLAFSSKPNPESIERLQEDIEEFTSRAGREKGWTDLSVDERIFEAGSVLGGSIPTLLHWSRFAIYRHSSEILHGTLFGALHFLGLTQPGGKPRRSLPDFEDSIGQQHVMVLLAAQFVLFAIVETFHGAYGFLRVFEQSEELFAELRNIPLLSSDNESSTYNG
jgi:hypothetical protein